MFGLNIRRMERKIMIVGVKGKAGQTPYPWIKKIAQGALKKLRLNQAELSIQVVDNRKIKDLNKKYRGINRVTDVLAFPQREGKFAGVYFEMLGDIVICLPQAKLQAGVLGHSFKKEVAVLLVHGLLHLLGFEDGSDKKRRQMFQRQEQLLEWLEENGFL